MGFSIGALVPLLALLIPIVAIVMMNWRKVQMRRMDLEERGRIGLGREAAERIRALEERVQVLERLATDPAGRLEQEINQLKDDRP